MDMMDENMDMKDMMDKNKNMDTENGTYEARWLWLYDRDRTVPS